MRGLKNPNVVTVHCVIHGEARASKALPENMHSVVSMGVRRNFSRGATSILCLFFLVCCGSNANGQGPSLLENFRGTNLYCLCLGDVTMFAQPYYDLFVKLAK